jgi:transcriptional regulator with XRE-family HTH domain
MFTQCSQTDITRRIRTIRKAAGLSLADVERLSGGVLKAVVLGSYERGTRSLSAQRLIDIASILNVPVTTLVSDSTPQNSISTSRILIDIRRLSQLSHSRSHTFDAFYRFSLSIIHERQDWNGEVLSLRSTDIEYFQRTISGGAGSVMQWLRDNSLLIVPNERLSP